MYQLGTRGGEERKEETETRENLPCEAIMVRAGAVRARKTLMSAVMLSAGNCEPAMYLKLDKQRHLFF